MLFFINLNVGRKLIVDIELIYAVSEIDKEILLIQREISDKTIPKKLTELKNEYCILKNEYEELKSEMETKSRVMKEFAAKNENTIKEAKEIEARLYSSSNLKTIEAMQHSLDKLNNEIQNNEDTIYTHLEEQERNKKRKNEYRLKLNEISKSYNPVKNEYQEHIKALKESISNLIDKRNSIISKLDNNIVNEYEAIRKNKGYGMSLLKGEICTGCGMSVPYIIISNAKRHNSLQKCPNCGRFLYNKE